ncbi:MAG: DUF3419 family protein [Gammaproteobacteria bacterium]|nr:DUF3419 family protein [Gammaproteobacteria bacterium]
MDFYNYLNYSLGNEDWGVEEQALRVNPGDAVVCVTASGDRPLHLLMTECAEIVSIDMNSIQNYLLELKIAAITHLDFDQYTAFLGLNSTTHRYTIFQYLIPHLSPATVQHWDKNKKMIERGILFQGRIERLTHFSSKIIKLFRHKKINTLFEYTDLSSQREYIANEWDTLAWRKIFEVLLNPTFSKLMLKDPGLNSYTDMHPGKYIYQKMLAYLQNNLASKSALLQLMLLGKILPSAYFPYLTFEGYTKIRKNTERLTYKTGNMIDYLNLHAINKFDCFSMSDIASYMPQDIFDKLLLSMYKAAKPKARFCLREFTSKRNMSEAMKNSFVRNEILEHKLEHEESNFVYRFMVGEIQK